MKIEEFKRAFIKTRDNVLEGDFLVTLDKAHSINWLACKEEAAVSFKKTNDHFFAVEDEVDIDQLIATIHLIEDDLDIPHSRITVIKDFAAKPLLKIRSGFWFKNVIHFDMFCCIYKTLFTLTVKKMKKIKGYNDLNKQSYYFSHSYMIKALGRIKTLCADLGIKTQESQERFINNFNGAGIINGINSWTNKNNDEAQKLNFL